MALPLDQIDPGVVAWIDTRVLLADPRLMRASGSGVFRSGPFLCVAVGPGYTTWLELTTRPGKWNHRFHIRREWRTGGPAFWRAHDNYVNNVAETFVGRDVVFADAARNEPHNWPQNRARVAPEGIEAITLEMRSRNCLTV